MKTVDVTLTVIKQIVNITIGNFHYTSIVTADTTSTFCQIVGLSTNVFIYTSLRFV